MGATRLYPDNIDKNRTRDSNFIAWFIANGDYFGRHSAVFTNFAKND